MSQIPRRTSEFQVGSAKRSTKPNRSTLLRAQSSQSTNVRQSASSSHIPRVSATPMRTPARTPNRSATKDRSTMIQMTAEKEKAPTDDREVLQAKTQLILEELSKEPIFNELVSKGLRSMTHKNFIMILDYFIKKIRTVPKDFATTYIDFVPNLLHQLEYPYNINKSSLKTPNAPHCMNSIIILIGWLAEFSKCDDGEINYVLTEELPNFEMVNFFMKQTKEAFSVFNEGKDTTDIENRISDTYSKMRSEGSKDVNAEIDRLNFEIEQLTKESKPLSLLTEVNTKQDESHMLNEKIEMHNKNIGELNRKIANLEGEFALKQDAETSSRKELYELQLKFKNQKITMDKRQNMLIEITQMKSELMSKRNATMELQESGAKNEIQLSNCISRKFQLIDCLNNLICTLSSELKIIGIENDFDSASYEIKSTRNDENMDQMITRMQKGLKELRDKYIDTHSMLKEALIKAEIEYNRYKTNNDLYEVKVRTYQNQLDKLIEEEATIEDELTSLIHNIQSNFNDRVEKINRSKKEYAERLKEIEKHEKSNNKLKNEKTAFGERVVGECQRLYEERKVEVENYRKQVRDNLTMIENYNKKKKPLPENLQKTLDRVLSRHKKNKENHQS